MTPPDPELVRSLTAALAATEHLASEVDAVRLFTDAARAAHRIPGPLGTAVAAVLFMAAYERRLTGLRGSLGCSKTDLALALAAMEYMPD